MTTKHNLLNIRYQAVCMVEAATPLAVHSGDKDILLDNPIIRDAFDLPYIPATSLTGVMRHSLSSFSLTEDDVKAVFGYQEEENLKEGEEDPSHGSRIILSSAHLLASNNQVADGLEMATELREALNDLLIFPMRDHVRINHKGVADKSGHGKFESELLPKGTRFVFEIELWGTSEDTKNWKEILDIISHPMFRIGGGTRKGFGELKVIKMWERKLNLKEPEGMELYLNKTTQITIPTVGYEERKIMTKDEIEEIAKENLIHYQLKLTPRDFFLFDGNADFIIDEKVIEQLKEIEEIKDEKKRKDEEEKLLKSVPKFADMNPKTEIYIEWENDINPKPSEHKWLIPATSVKGAISHRVAFHYNKLTEFFANQQDNKIKEIQDFIAKNPQPKTEEDALQLKEEIKKHLESLKNTANIEGVGENNEAVKILFGYANDKDDKDKSDGQRGRVIFSDVYIDKNSELEKPLNHVSIDRFTGGAIDTALFSEKVIGTETEYTLDIYVEKSAFEICPNDTEDCKKDIENIEKAFLQALSDLANEQLPLGGGVMRGHGMMKGSITENGVKI